MSRLLVPLAPPTPNDPSKSMTPLDWTRRSEIQETIQSRSSVNLNVESLDQLQFEPRLEVTDLSIMDYYTRTEPCHHDRGIIYVTIPIDKVLEQTLQMRQDLHNEKLLPSLKAKLKIQGTSIKELKAKEIKTDNENKSLSEAVDSLIISVSSHRDQIKFLRTEINSLKAHNKSQDVKIEARDVEIAEHASEIVKLKAENVQLNAEGEESDRDRLWSFLANIFVKLIKKLAAIRSDDFEQGVNDPAHSTNRYQQYVAGLRKDDKAKRAWIKDTGGLSFEYIDDLENLKDYQDKRNLTAHETESSLARLLLSRRYKDTYKRKYYARAFRWVYDMDIEDAAKVESNPEVRTEEELERKFALVEAME